MEDNPLNFLFALPGFSGAVIPIKLDENDRRFSVEPVDPTAYTCTSSAPLPVEFDPSVKPVPIFENRPLMASNTGDMGMCYAEDNSLPRPIGDAYPTAKLVDERPELEKQFEVCKKSTVEGVDFTPDPDRKTLSMTGTIKDIATGDMLLERHILQEKVLKLAADNEDEVLLRAIAQSDSDTMAYDYFLRLRARVNSMRDHEVRRKRREGE